MKNFLGTIALLMFFYAGTSHANENFILQPGTNLKCVPEGSAKTFKEITGLKNITIKDFGSNIAAFENISLGDVSRESTHLIFSISDSDGCETEITTHFDNMDIYEFRDSKAKKRTIKGFITGFRIEQKLHAIIECTEY